MNSIIDEAKAALSTGSDGAALTPFQNFTDEGLDRVRQIYSALVPTRDSLAVLFAIDAAQTAPTDQWTSFFIETACAHLIWEERPTGALVEQDASWLLARFDDAPSLSIMGLLVRILDEAQRTPTWFAVAVRHRASLFRSVLLSAEAAQQRKKPVPYLRLVA